MTEYEPPYLCHQGLSPQAFLPHPGRASTPSPQTWAIAGVKTCQPALLTWLVQASPLVSTTAACSPISLLSADFSPSFLFPKTSLPQGYHVIEFDVEKIEREISVLLSTQNKVE